MKRILVALGLSIAIALAACAETPATPGTDGSSAPSPSESSARLDAYEALILHLADPDGPAPIYVLTDLCYQLMQPEITCPDHLSPDDQRGLQTRLQDLGELVFIADGDPAGPSPEDSFQEILLGPIVEKPDGLRVEGGSVCGGLCGSGAVYRLVATQDGYEVTGTDDTYGAWIS